MAPHNQKVSQIHSDSFKIRNPNLEIQMTKTLIAFWEKVVLNIGKLEF